MDHIAVMSKHWKWKQIESRWLVNKSAPWGKVSKGETIYFKDSGGPIKVKAKVNEIKEFEREDFEKPIEIMNKYLDANKWAKGKRYCVLIWLGRPTYVNPFRIAKQSRAGWLSIEDIDILRL